MITGSTPRGDLDFIAVDKWNARHPVLWGESLSLMFGFTVLTSCLSSSQSFKCH